MKSGYEQLVWISDKQGKEYVCSLEGTAAASFEQLSDGERERCSDVSQIIGTECW